MKFITIKDAQPAKDNFCPSCKNPTAKIITPIAYSKSFCFNCKIWFDTKKEDCIVPRPENIEELRSQIEKYIK